MKNKNKRNFEDLIIPYRAPNRSGKKYKNKKQHIKATLKWRRRKHKNNPYGKNPGDVVRNKTADESYKVGGMKNAPEPREPNAFHPKGKNPGDVYQYNEQREEPQGHKSIKQKLAYRGKVLGMDHDACLNDPKGKNPGDVILDSGSFRKVKRSLLPKPQVRKNHDLHYDGTGYNPMGKNPGDVITARDWRKEEKAGFKRGATNPHRAANIGGLLSGKAKNHPFGKNPGDVLRTGFHHGSSLSKRAVHTKGRTFTGCSSGKNPGDVMLSPKYISSSGHSNRQGLNRKLNFREKRIFKTVQIPIANYLKSWKKRSSLTVREISKITRIKKSTVEHWFRTDLSGSCLPSTEQWMTLKNVLGFDDRYDDIMTKTVIVDNLIRFSNEGKNPGDFWTISTKPFPEAHFAVFPEELCIRPILSSCPELVCKGCSKPRKQTTKIGGSPEAFNIRVRDVRKGKIKNIDRRASNQEIKNYDEKAYTSIPSKWIISEGCNCRKGHEPGIVLDPFCGSGTACLVAKKLGRRWIGIDIKAEYCKMARKRIRAATSNKGI